MKQLLYPLLASALITIVPFLLSFEKGQDIVRGLFGFEYFVILLLWVSLKSRKFEWQWAKIFQKCLLVFFGVLLLAVAFVDLSNLWHIKGWNFGFYVLVPLVTCAVALVMVSKVPSLVFGELVLFCLCRWFLIWRLKIFIQRNLCFKCRWLII